MKRIKYAIAGFGGIAQNRIAPEGFALDRDRFAPLREAELIGLWSRNPERKILADKLGLHYFDSYEKLLASSEVDAIFIASNNLTHAPLALQALKAKKHVILEKPMAVSLAEAKKLVDTARRQMLSLSVNHMMKHNIFNRKARELIRSGALGEILNASLRIEFYHTGSGSTQNDWRCADPRELGGPIGDVGSHAFYMTEFLFDSPIVKVAAVYYPKTLPIPVEDGALVRCKLASGLQAVVQVAFSEKHSPFSTPVGGNIYEIYGKKGFIRTTNALGQLSGHSDEANKILLEFGNDWKIKKLRPGKPKNIYRQVIAEHAKSILTGKLLDGTEGAHNTAICLAAHQSARKGGKWIDVEK